MTGRHASDAALRARSLIFLHIPKAGGQTVRRILERQYGAGIYTIPVPAGPKLDRFLALPADEKRKIKALQGHMHFGLHLEMPVPCTYMTFLREPVDRAISYYYFILRTPKHTYYPVLVEGKVGLADYARRGISRLGTDNGQVRFLCGLPESSAEVPFGQVTRGMLEVAQANLREYFSVTGLLEDFDRSIMLMKRVYGWRLPFYQRENVGTNRPPLQQTDPDVRELIASQNRLDQELYEYARALFDERCAELGPRFRLEVALFRWLNARRPAPKPDSAARRRTPR